MADLIKNEKKQSRKKGEDELPANEESEDNWSGSTSTPMAGRIYGTMEDLEKATEEEISMSDEIRECVQNCLDCYRACTQTTIKCINTGGKHSESRHLNLLMDCSKICNVNTDFMLRNSRYYPQTCEVTADICDKCADDCEKFEEEFMKECAIACRRCAKSCKEMAK